MDHGVAKLLQDGIAIIAQDTKEKQELLDRILAVARRHKEKTGSLNSIRVSTDIYEKLPVPVQRGGLITMDSALAPDTIETD